mgnify:CR=1 FL=1
MGRALATLGRSILKLLGPTGRALFWIAGVKPYELVLRIKRQVITLLRSNSTLELLIRSESIFILLALTATIVCANSWRIRHASAEQFGQNNLLFPLIRNENDFLVTEDANSNLIAPSLADANEQITDTQTGTTESELTLTQGGIALSKPILITTEPGVAARIEIEYHVVKSGETLSQIAGQYGLQMNTLLWANNLSSRSLLQVGQKLAILPVNGITHKISKGDTLASIAKRYSAKTDEIQEFNSLSGKLVVGTVLVVPGGRPPAAPRPPTTTRPSLATSQTSLSSVQTAGGAGKFLWPTTHRRLTQYYSWRHSGVDIAGPIGTPIYAAESGTVQTAAWNRGGYGYYIIINHGGGVQTLYGHNSKMLVSAGNAVERGQLIALMGSTGRSTGPHLHFEVRIGSRRTNPLNYIR